MQDKGCNERFPGDCKDWLTRVCEFGRLEEQSRVDDNSTVWYCHEVSLLVYFDRIWVGHLSNALCMLFNCGDFYVATDHMLSYPSSHSIKNFLS